MSEAKQPTGVTHEVTVWYDVDSLGTMERLQLPRASHVATRLHPATGRAQVLLCDEAWRATGVEEFRVAHRISVRVVQLAEGET